MTNLYDSEYAKANSTRFDKAALRSLYNAPPDMYLNHVDVVPLDYGEKAWKLGSLNADERISSGARFKRQEKHASVNYDTIDLRCLFDSMEIERSDKAANPAIWEKFGQDKAKIFLGGLNTTLWAGFADVPIVYGMTVSGEAASRKSPYWITPITAGGTSKPWYTTANARAEIIAAEIALKAKGFEGPFHGVCPGVCQPMFSELVTNTAVTQGQWLTNALGLPIYFDNNADSDASATAFDFFVIQDNSIHYGLTDTIFDDFYDNKDHSDYKDIEVYGGIAYDVRKSGSDYFKGICKISAAAFLSA